MILYKSEVNPQNLEKMQKLKRSKEMINKKIFDKLNLLCSQIVQKTELLCEDFVNNSNKKMLHEKKPDESKEEKKRIDFLISFIKRYA